MKKDNTKGSKQVPESFSQEILLDPHGDLFPDRIQDIDERTLSDSYRRLQLIYFLGHSILGNRDLDQLLKATLDALTKSIQLERCFIASFDQQGNLQPLIDHDIQLSENFGQWPVSKTIITRTLKEGISILSSDALHDKRFSKAESVGFHNIRSVVCVPLGQKGSCTGVIYADSRVESNVFSELDLQFLSALSHYIHLGIRNASELLEIKSKQLLSDERCVALQQELFREHQIVGRSNKLLKAYEDLRRVAVKDLTVLLLGETGTGKDLFAKAAHRLSRRSDKTFMPLNIAELSEALIESELFGHEKGAFSGALTKKIGRLEMAHEGTLFLDEVAEIPLNIQVKLLRVLETGEFMRVGGTKWINTNVRLVCATRENLEKAVKNGKFREDLYYRLRGVTIHIPPLRDRSDDIPELIRTTLKEIDSKKTFNKSAIKRMQIYSWPGNVRELINVVKALDALSDANTIETGDLPTKMVTSARPEAPGFPPLQEVLARAEENHIRRALKFSKGNNDRAIKLLGIARATFFERKKRYNL